MHVQHFLTINDLPPGGFWRIIDLARDIKLMPAAYADTLTNQALAMIFEKPSLRTRVTFEIGIAQLGGFAVYLAPSDIGLGKREGIIDVARNLSRWAQGIMARTFAHETVVTLAEYATIPVINGLTDLTHPCQAMADYLTMLEHKGRLHGLCITYVGDGNNVAHSLMFGAAQCGAHLTLATPPGYEPDRHVVLAAREAGHETGAVIEVTNDPYEAVIDADVVYTDTWISMGHEAEAAARHEIFAPYQVNSRLMAVARPDAIFMHCLPCHRGEEVTADVLESAQAAVYDQAENRLHVQKAIMVALMRPAGAELCVDQSSSRLAATP